MKIKTLLFTLFSSIAVCSAQIDLDINDCPSTGLELIISEYYSWPGYLTDSVDIGPAGANENYDISKITSFQNYSDTISFITPEQTHWESFHPGANLSMLDEIELDSASGDTLIAQYSYYHVDQNGCMAMGISFMIDTGFLFSQVPSGTTLEVHANYDPASVYMNTDYQMGFNAMDTSSWEVNMAGIYHSENKIRDIHVDGYGQLNTPDSVVDVLRVRIIEYVDYYTEVNGNILDDDSDTSYYYEFWTNGIGDAVAVVYMDQNWNYINSIRYTTVNKEGNGYTFIDEAVELSLSLYPNPANEHLTIETNRKDNLTVDIYNILGEKIRSFDTGSEISVINVLTLQNGIYIVNFMTGNKVIRTEKFVVNH